ncbi:complex I NDUFA9 subunit family protein [Taklimakanibacter deserti]|uniref:complex I NDUFA9 subunit family protein n=1 Tax=Taklimakanibacter deserti TaxID=2267839 RepID=UPI000E648C7C
MTRIVVVFGGTGFLGRRVVHHVLEHGFAVRVAARHPDRGKDVFAGRSPELEMIRADIGDDASIRDAVEGAYGVVNAVSLYVERDGRTFHSVHVEAARRLAEIAQAAGVARLVHVSGIGADAASPSPYIRSRGEGENAVRAAFPQAAIVRPAVMFGPDDAFLVPLAGFLREFPAFPLFGSGQTRLQPAYVEDVGEAIARIIATVSPQAVYEFGGPRVWTYRELLQKIGDRLGRQRKLIPLPFAAWQALASMAEFLPEAPITRNQVELMAIDTVASPACAGFDALGIAPAGIEKVLAEA